MRARQPDESGYAVDDGVRIYYEVHGIGSPTLLLMPTWAIADSRHWKMQVPYLARRYRVVLFDPRGNGRSDRPQEPSGYSSEAYLRDLQAVLEATATGAAVVVAHCAGVAPAMLLAERHPELVTALVAISPTLPLAPGLPERRQFSFDEELDTDEGWAKQNRHYWKRHWREYVEFHSGKIASEPHSTKVFDDLVGWGLQTDATTMLCEVAGDQRPHGREDAEALCRGFPAPVLVISGDQDRLVNPERARRMAELTDADLLILDGAGHAPHVRFPVAVNHAIVAFVDRVAPPPPRAVRWCAPAVRRPRALWISSPIGLGHVLRDLAIANALRRRIPELEIHWWAQPPVTGVLAAAGETIHPASAQLVSESEHWESCARAHRLPAFDAFRQMDEIFCANYLLFDDVIGPAGYDLWVGDESWEIDYFLHENPDRKRAPYAFLTDVIGFLPSDPDGDPREAGRCADYNADAIEKRERFPWVRDASLFIGGWNELPDESFGPGLPGIRDWSRRWYTSVPYVPPFRASDYRAPGALRSRLGFPARAPQVVAAVGGTSVGAGLLELAAEAFGRLHKELPDSRMLLVAGPRIDPAGLPDVEGMDKRGYVPALFEYLAGADLAVVQGGLSTTMELVAARRPFLYFPLRGHWEQQHFVAHRLQHYRAGVRMDFERTTPQDLADAMRTALTERARPVYRRIPPGGADRAAARLAEVLGR